MPIDTRNKRASATQAIALMTMPNPSGTIGTAAREHATWLYSGITPQITVPRLKLRTQNPHWEQHSE